MRRIALLIFLISLVSGLYAQTTPPSAQYRYVISFTISAPGSYDTNCPGNEFEIYFYYPSSGWKEVEHVTIGGSVVLGYMELYVVTPTSEKATQMYIVGSRQYNRSISGCTSHPNGTSPTTILPSSICTSATYNNDIPNWTADVTVSLEPVQVAVTPVSGTLANADQITLTATPGYDPGVYTWQYSTDGNNWTNFPPNFQGLSTISFTGVDLFGSSFIGMIPSNTFVRVNEGCGGLVHHLFNIGDEPYSNTVTLNDELSSPHLLSVTPSPTLCNGDRTGSIQLAFDRPLLSGETLTIELTDNTNTINSGSQSAPNVTLDANNVYTFYQDLPSANYTIGFNGFYGGTNTYTDGVGQSANVTVTTPAAVSYTPSVTDNVHCYGGSDGVITTTASGGVGGYKLGYELQGAGAYTWIPFTAGGQTLLSGLTPNAYDIRVMDANGCVEKGPSQSETITTLAITQPAAPLALDFSQVTNPLGYGLADGSITAVLKGGTPTSAGAYNIDWTDSLGNTVSTMTNINIGSSYQTIMQDGANGEYTLTATDDAYALAAPGQQAGCMVQQSFTLKQPPPLIVAIAQTQRVTCYGTTTAALVAHAQGGVPIPFTDYNYQWYSVAGGVQTAIGTNDSTISPLPAGDYQVKITDKNNITATAAFTIGQPAQLTIEINTTPLACNSDTNSIATTIVTGGTLPYTYSWSTGDTSAVIGGLAAGGYFLFVSDSNACQAQQTATVTSPTGLVVDSIVTNPSCHGRCDGSVLLNVTGGAGGYSYAWTGAVNSGASLTSLCIGDYGVTVSDQNGCSVTQHYQLVDPPSVAVNAGQNTTLCTGQVYNANATIADPAAQYAWTGPNGFSSTAPAVSLTDSGLYHVQVTNGTGCSGVDSFTLSRIDKIISADFVVSTQAFAGQPVTLINIASPDPDSIAWQLPPGAGISVISSDSVSLTIQFADTGTYTVGMKSWLAPCWLVNSQQILVLSSQTFSNPGSINDPLVASFTVSPNPSSGAFTALVTLNSTANIRLRLLSTTSGAVFDDRQLSGLSTYTVNYSMGNLAKGSYFLLLETPAGSTIYEIVII